MKSFFALLAAILLVSCATGPLYPQGPPDLSKSALFLPSYKPKTPFLTRTEYLLGGIDGMARGRTVRFPTGEKGIAVIPGDHRMTVAVFHGEPGHGMLSAEATIPIKIQAGKTYELAGSIVSRQRVDFWIRDRSTQKQESKTISAVATDHGLPTFIVVPAG
ncbi:MAG: hypothetical protein V4689_04205 [Verrucomicrobiota bacterium]